jgi:sugar/nucleoside kinase (ribokinase family)
MDFSAVYQRELKKDFESKKMLVLHDANIDLLHLINEEKVLKALNSYKLGYKNSEMLEEIVLRMLKIANSTGGEIMIDDLRDEFNNFKPFLQKDSERIIFTLGGNAGNASIALARLGAEPWISTAVRDDKYGRWISTYLGENGVRTELLRILDGSREEAMTYGIEIPGRDRGFLNDSTDLRNFEISDKVYGVDFDGMLMLGLHKLKTGFENALQFVREMRRKSRVISDGGDYSSLSSKNIELLFEIFRNTDLCCMNENELAFCLKASGRAAREGKDAKSTFENAMNFREALDLRCLNIHTELYSFDLSKEMLSILPTLEPAAFVVKTGLGDAYVAGRSFGFLQGYGSLCGLALGNTAAVMKLEGGEFPTMQKIKGATIKIKEKGKENVEEMLRMLKAEGAETEI